MIAPEIFRIIFKGCFDFRQVSLVFSSHQDLDGLALSTEFSLAFRSFIQAEFSQGSIFFANLVAHFAVNPRRRVGVAICFDRYVIFYGR